MAFTAAAGLGGALSATNAACFIRAGTVAPVDGTSGTLAGVAEPGSLYLNVTVFVISVNAGTKASPVWRTATPFYRAGAPVDGTTGTGVGYNKGTLAIDTTNGVLYINTNTAASPTWTKVGTQT